MRRFEGKVAIVTAATAGEAGASACARAAGHAAPVQRHRGVTLPSADAGIGLGIARRLAQEGAKVVVSSRRQQNVDETVAALKAEGLDVVGCVCHVGNVEHIKSLVQVRGSEHGLATAMGVCRGQHGVCHCVTFVCTLCDGAGSRGCVLLLTRSHASATPLAGLPNRAYESGAQYIGNLTRGVGCVRGVCRLPRKLMAKQSTCSSAMRPSIQPAGRS